LRPKITHRRRSSRKHVALLGALEEALERLVRDVLDLPRQVGAVASEAERLLVDIGRVDLDPVAKRLITHDPREHHGERIRLLARRTPGAPNPDRRLAWPRVQKLGRELGAHVLPRLGVPEERGGVDQQRVEQLRELLAMEFEVVDVVVMALDADGPMRLATRRWIVERL
jgi:hypothetical protein